MSSSDDRGQQPFPAGDRVDASAAAASFRAILEREPDNVNALHLLGLVYLNAGSLAEADAMLTRALALRPRSGRSPQPARSVPARAGPRPRRPGTT